MPDITSLEKSVRRWGKELEAKGFIVEITPFKSGHYHNSEASNVLVLVEQEEEGSTVLYQEFKFLANNYAASSEEELSGTFTEMKTEAQERLAEALKHR